MFQVNSYLKKPQVNITDLDDLASNPNKYFVEITDSAELINMSKRLDFQYLYGAICLHYFGEYMLDTRHWDLVDQLWAYIVNVIEDVLQKGDGTAYFPDQPIKLSLREVSKELLLFSIEGEIEKVYPKNSLLLALIQGAEQFFSCMTEMFSSYRDYSHELEKISEIKKVIQ